MKLDKICDIERVKEGKLYHKGTILIQVSASNGQMTYLKEPQRMDMAKYVSLIPKIDIDTLYLYTMIESQIEEFVEKYKTGLNIQVESLSRIDVPIKPIKTQKVISNFIKLFDLYYKQNETMIELEKDLKKNMLENMFV